MTNQLEDQKTFDKIYVLDTNIILTDANQVLTIGQNGKNLIVLPETVIDELDNKKSGFGEINYQAREFGRILSDAEVIKTEKFSNSTIMSVVVQGISIDIISLDDYNLNDVDKSILNDRKIIKVAQRASSYYKNSDVILLSNDIMCRTRAISLGVKTEALDQNKENLNHSFIKVLEGVNSSHFNVMAYKHISEYDPDWAPGTYCYHFKATDGNEKIAYIVNGHINFIDDEMFNGLSVKPLNVGQKFAMAGMLDERLDVCVVEALAGCCVAGTTIDINCEFDFNKKNIMSKYKLTQNEYARCLRLGAVNKDNNEIKEHLIEFIKYTSQFNHPNFSRVLNRDSKYKSKYCKLEYWLSFKSPEYSLLKVSQLRRYSKYFETREYDEKLFRLFNPKTFQKTLMYIQSELIKSEPLVNSNDILCMTAWSAQFWIDRGWSKEYAILKASEMQRQNSLKMNEKYSVEEQRKIKGYTTSIQYFIDMGHDNETAAKLLKERQTTFSLEKCIERYGEESGIKRWRERQQKWQDTINSKSDEELADINRRKSSGIGRYLDRTVPGKIYYMKFYNKDIEFWKVGITSKTIDERFSLSTFKEKYGLNHEVIFSEELTSIQEAYNLEQKILSKFNSDRINVSYNGFVTTEAFKTNVLKEFYNEN